ncbi:hypothetical protein [Novosphingobium sp. SG720]|uniref:hypothetical protein n=1 Tax=Novosphingobium sp. SG720 TaxID=2586998 RepID=UPI001446995A|nr:hypothetical protein [Novosphingobium sp. SG720]NKJ44189.1 hypothetical protein [Novosphingobium sp. SG720]
MIVVNSTHKSNFHLVEIAAQGLQSWPLDIERMARANVNAAPKQDEQQKNAKTAAVTSSAANQTLVMFHPDLGRYILHIYGVDENNTCDDVINAKLDDRSIAIGYEQGQHPGQGIRLQVAGAIRNDPDAGPRKIIACFMARVPLDRLINTSVEDTPISHFLLVDGSGHIVAQLGDPPLPIDTISGLAETGAMGRNLAREIGSGLGAKSGEGTPEGGHDIAIGAVRDVVAMSVGGEDYLAYIKPFLVPNAVSQPCGGATGGAGANPAGTTACYVVALMPQSAMTKRWLETMPVERMGALLVLLFLAVLLPFLRFQLMGAGQSSRRIEVIAMLAGVPAALVLALFMVLLAHDTDAGRQSTARAAATTAQNLARAIGTQVHAQARQLATLLAGERPDISCAGFAEANVLYEDGMLPPRVKPGDNVAVPADGRLCSLSPRRPVAVDLSGRDYFQRLRDQPETANTTTANSRSIAWLASGVRSQTMGLDTAVLAARLQGEPGQADRYAAGAFQLDALLQPARLANLRPDQRFMVVETRNWAGDDLRLPVIFHAQRGHAGLENLAEQAEADRAIPGKIVALARPDALGGKPEVLHFNARYGGRQASFAAMPVPGTSWVVLVWSNLAETDAVAARTTSLALWSALALLVLMVLVAGGLLLGLRVKPGLPGLCPPARWADLWPHQAGAEVYAWLARRVGPLAIGILIVALVLALTLHTMAPALAFCALAVPAAVVSMGVWVCAQPDSDEALTPKAERPFHHLVVGLIALMALVPGTLVWLDARAFSVAHHRNDQAIAARLADVDRDRRAHLVATAQCQGIPVDGLTLAGQEAERNACIGRLVRSQQREDGEPASTQWPASALASAIWSMRQGHWFGDGVAAPTDLGQGRNGGSYDIEWLPPLDWLALLVFGVVPLVALWLWLPRLVLRALCGFGVPLGVAAPEVAGVRTAPRLLVVGGDHASREALMGELDAQDAAGSVTIDLSDVLLYPDPAKLGDQDVRTLAAGLMPQAGILQVYGLSLLLRDAARRRAALVFLEQADRAVRNGKLRQLVVYSDLTPLERILDVVDAENAGQVERTAGLEELRWARFFQTFVTHTPKDGGPLIDRAMVDEDEALLAPAKALLHELRHLPRHIVATLLPGVDSLSEGARPAALCAWASGIKLPTVPAAIDFLRVHLIEYYEQLWFASTQAECVVLDAIARGHHVNIHASLVLRSLVRRRLVTLEPGPRLFNESFAMFVRQAERPKTIRRWRARMPQGDWNLARWPLLVGVPLGLLLVAYGAAQQGDNLNATISALLAGIPMLIGAFSRRQAAG